MILLPFLTPSIQVAGPLFGPASTYRIVEFTVNTGRTYGNPFDPDEVAVHGIFSGDGTRIDLPAFWDGKEFRLRFCPTKPGMWRLQVEVESPSGKETTTGTVFRADGSEEDGFVRASKRNPRYLELDSGKSLVPIGLNLCWPDKSGLESYDHRFAKLRSVGGNFARIWTTQERRLETKEAELGRYDLDSAANYDGIFRLAARHGIRTMFTFDDYRVLAKTDYFNAHWADSPYNSANGGPLAEPTDFFASPISRRLYKQRLRYLVARYSAFSSLAMWELYNEQDNIPKPGVPISWFREMTGYLASIDPYRHLITTSYSWDDKPEVWQSPAVGLTQRHMYGQGDTIDFVPMIIGNAKKLEPYGKPRLIGEFGITWKEPDIKLDTARLGTPLHDALWASIMSGDAGGALTWWWDNYLEPLNLWPVFVGISKFVQKVDFAHRDLRPLALHVDGLTALALSDRARGESILWLHDPASNWKADAEGQMPKDWRDVIVSVPASRPTHVVAFDTRTGEAVEATNQVPASGMVQVRVPAFRRDIAFHLTAS